MNRLKVVIKTIRKRGYLLDLEPDEIEVTKSSMKTIKSEQRAKCTALLNEGGLKFFNQLNLKSSLAIKAPTNFTELIRVLLVVILVLALLSSTLFVTVQDSAYSIYSIEQSRYFSFHKGKKEHVIHVLGRGGTLSRQDFNQLFIQVISFYQGEEIALTVKYP